MLVNDYKCVCVGLFLLVGIIFPVSLMETHLKKPRKIVNIRHGERYDGVYKDWFNKSFNSEGIYTRFDLNLAKTLPKRKNYQDYKLDCPLTEIGHLQAKLYGEIFSEYEFDFQHVFSSPALRSIQTCQSILQGYNKPSMPIAIEFGLFDVGFLYPSMPNWMTIEELNQTGVTLDLNYHPILSRERSGIILEEINVEIFFQRLDSIYNQLLKNLKNKDGDILIVSHGSTVFYNLYKKFNLNVPTVEDTFEISKVDTYCSYSVFEENLTNLEQEYDNELDKWEFIDIGLPSLKHNVKNIYKWQETVNATREITRKHQKEESTSFI